MSDKAKVAVIIITGMLIIFMWSILYMMLRENKKQVNNNQKILTDYILGNGSRTAEEIAKGWKNKSKD